MSFQKNYLQLQQRRKKFKPTGALKNSTGYSKDNWEVIQDLD